MRTLKAPITVVGTGLSIVIAFLLVLFGDDDISSLNVGLIGIVISLLLDIITRLHHNEMVLDNLSKDPWLHKVVQEIGVSYIKVRDGTRDSFFLESGQSALEDCAKILMDLSKGHLFVTQLDESVILPKLILKAKKEVRAASHVSLLEWWTKEWGRKYLQTNAVVIERKRKITRVWIVPKASTASLRELVIEQCALGINVRIAIEEDQPDELIDSYLIVDKDIVSQSQIIPGGRRRRARITEDPREVQDFIRRFEALVKNSKGVKEVFGVECKKSTMP
jgi:hypothetical protein